MATGKTGLQYFPFNTDFFDDDKIMLIESEFGSKGALIAVKLLCKIYGENYFYKWGDEECLLFSRKAGADIVPGFVGEVVQGLIRRSFFNKRVFDSFHVLTSKGIQTRYFEAALRRKKIDVNSDYLLCDVSEYKNVRIIGKDVNIMGSNVDILTQSKVKESKVKEKETKVSEGSSPSTSFGSYEGKKNLDELVKIFSADRRWIEVACMKHSKSPEEIVARLEAFKLHCENIKTGPKTEQDFATHFLNWKGEQHFALNGKRSSGGFPDHWDRQYETKLHGSELSAYWDHLRSKGLRPKRNRFQVVTDWVPESQINQAS
jgi:hypothetical protein